MKRILSFILCLTLVLPLLGCGTPKGNGSAAAVQAFSVGTRINSAELRWGKVRHRAAPGGVAEPRVS